MKNFIYLEAMQTFKRDFIKSKNPILLVGGTDLSLEITKKRKNLNEIFYIGQNKDLNFVKVKKNNLHIGAATPINEILELCKTIPSIALRMEKRKGIDNRV